MGTPSPGIFKQVIPPALLAAARWLRGMCGVGISFSGNYACWKDASLASSGYDADEILDRVEKATSLVVSGAAAYERDAVLFDHIPHAFPVLAGLLRAAAENGRSLTVLDFGGSLGSSYRQCHAFLSVVRDLEWRIVEQEQFVHRGRERFETKQLRFFMSCREAATAGGRKADVVLLSSVLQYLGKPYETLDELCSLGCRYMIIDATPFAGINADRLVVQHVPPSIYPASYPCWIFSRERFMANLEPTWEILAEFSSADGLWMAGGSSFEFGGMILRKKD